MTATKVPTMLDPAVPPCPGWCAGPDHHEYHSIQLATGDQFRNHEAPAIGDGEFSVTVSNEETMNGDGVVKSSALYIYVGVESEHLDAGQARTFAAVLLEADKQLDEITGGAA